MSRIGPGDTLRILLIAERESLREQIGAILAQYAGALVLEGLKGLLGHKRELRRARVAAYGQLLRDGLG